jgi:uncharacterized protein YjbJ (UPF0337 family)
MVNEQVLSGNWNEVRGKLKQKWGALSDDELTRFEGNVDQLIGKIQRKTGESREAIEHYLDQIASGVAAAASQVGEKLQGAAQSAMGTARHGYDALRERYGDAESLIQDRPAGSVAVAFGLGFAAGIGVMLLLRE